MANKSARKSRESASALNPGDQAPRGTPGTGENVCPQCRGTGRRDGGPCDYCSGTGKVITGIGGG